MYALGATIIYYIQNRNQNQNLDQNNSFAMKQTRLRQQAKNQNNELALT